MDTTHHAAPTQSPVPSPQSSPSISTHVLDVERGLPAPGVPVTLEWEDDEEWLHRGTYDTNQDGRIPRLLDGPLRPGRYRLTFDTEAYFHRQGGERPFFERVVLEIHVRDAERHYHVPLLLSRFACTSYRGS